MAKTTSMAFTTEPNPAEWNVDAVGFRVQYIETLNWLSMNFADKDFKEFALTKLRGDGVDLTPFEATDPSYFTTVGKIAWIMNKGGQVAEASMTFWNKTIAEIKARGAAKVETPKKAVVSKEPSPQLVFNVLYNKLEDMIDAGTIFDGNEVYNMVSQHKTRQGLLTSLKTHFTQAFDEFVNARSEENKEYFDGMTDKEVDDRIRAYKFIVDTLNAVSHNKRASRKGNKVTRTVAKKASTVKYKVNDTGLKVVSVDPTQVIGAKSLVAYNTKTRRIMLFVAAEGGLDLQGQSVKNFDEKLSLAKTLRKPEEQVGHFRDATGVRRVKVLMKDNIRGKSFEVSGRLNADTLLLKVFK